RMPATGIEESRMESRRIPAGPRATSISVRWRNNFQCYRVMIKTMPREIVGIAVALSGFAAAAMGQNLTRFEVHLEAGRTAVLQSRYSEGDRQLRLATQDDDANGRLPEALEA